MLVVPITGKISWKNPPIATITLVLLNCIIFFLFQLDDNVRFEQAHRHYYSSGLADIEISAYIEYKTAEKIPPSRIQETLSQDTLQQYNQAMRADAGFQEELDAGKIITPDNPNYQKWKQLRRKNEALLEGATFYQYGFTPARASVLTAFTYMFLHGGMAHLIGNMIFLWLVGCMLEMGCGRAFAIGTYLATGLFSVFFFWLVYMDSTIPLVGASGSIAGFMGAFTTVYGRTRIRAFYSLGFYFNYIRFPAIALFPIWIGNEIYQLFSMEHSNVAYVAHIGGLIGGAAIGWANLRFFKLHNETIFQEEPVDEISPLMEKALQCIGRLETEDARGFLLEILEKEPGNRDAAVHLYNAEKLIPQSKQYHQAAGRLLHIYCSRPEDYNKAYDLYQEYTKQASPPKLPPVLYTRLGSVFAAIGQTRLAEKILKMLLKKMPAQPGVPEGLLKLATAFQKEGNTDSWKKYLTIVTKSYPDSTEARIAKRALQEQ